ncbi:hypothetical protein M918_01930 [Clostridium sp. BL8]|uniref:hypothetical protein n=1 Tax=Clostridium sp. BL8 TaxID=1354301 RepID=UPI000389E7DD|nr:hypothetical protein [Clostridium sp. BL8]EQB90016.1 hypothetical protein M918_01930 [Clostridium sp. BL8]
MKKIHKNVYSGNVGKSRVWTMHLQKDKKSAKKSCEKVLTNEIYCCRITIVAGVTN